MCKSDEQSGLLFLDSSRARALSNSKESSHKLEIFYTYILLILELFLFNKECSRAIKESERSSKRKFSFFSITNYMFIFRVLFLNYDCSFLSNDTYLITRDPQI
jgi:hypothetical protein